MKAFNEFALRFVICWQEALPRWGQLWPPRTLSDFDVKLPVSDPICNFFEEGEVVTVYMTGLGALTTPVADGKGATAADSAVAAVQLYVNGTPVQPAGLL